jgi:hypothetical protein
MNRVLVIILLLGISTFSNSQQNTLGITFDSGTSLEGYTFFSPFSSTKAYIVDNCGRLVNEWDRGTRPGLSAYFLPSGNMLRTYKVNTNGPFTSASNAGGVELVDWDNNTLWRYELNTDTQLSHHDVVAMDNGNFLLLTWELEFEEDLIEWGRDPDEIAPQAFMWSEKIIEVEPTGSLGGNIVWEWNIKDHYIQDFDASKLNFGVVSDHPELYDINLADINSSNSNASRDWNHFNAIDYNEALDQILISVRNSDEIWIIDHSTTTEEAATHEGGTYGKGGDILFRWGNPAAYKRGEVSDQQLFGQHGVNWIREGLDDAGKIIIFNNGNGRPGPDFSTTELLDPEQAEPGFYNIPATTAIGPEVSDILFGSNNEDPSYSAFLSNAQRLSNGHTLMNYGSPGTIIEFDDAGEKVWEYVIPLNFDTPLNQGSNPGANSNFRAYKYAGSYEGFADIDLEAGSTLQIENGDVECKLTSSTENIYTDVNEEYMSVKLAEFAISIQHLDGEIARVQLYDYNGQLVKNITNILSSYANIDIKGMPSGMYLLIIQDEEQRLFRKRLVFIN